MQMPVLGTTMQSSLGSLSHIYATSAGAPVTQKMEHGMSYTSPEEEEGRV